MLPEVGLREAEFGECLILLLTLQHRFFAKSFQELSFPESVKMIGANILVHLELILLILIFLKFLFALLGQLGITLKTLLILVKTIDSNIKLREILRSAQLFDI